MENLRKKYKIKKKFYKNYKDKKITCKIIYIKKKARHHISKKRNMK